MDIRYPKSIFDVSSIILKTGLLNGVIYITTI